MVTIYCKVDNLISLFGLKIYGLVFSFEIQGWQVKTGFPIDLHVLCDYLLEGIFNAFCVMTE